MTLIALWNRTFGPKPQRRAWVRAAMRAQMRVQRRGKGNRAWRRAEQLDRRTDTITWPTMT
jgi:hypothetical protein